MVHRNAADRRERAILQRLRDQLGQRVYPVHRLDRQTSGCLLFATDPARVAPLHAALAAGQKTYLALVRGHWAHPPEVTVDAPLKADNGAMKEARSVVRLLATSRDPRCALVEIRPETGRFHQVRRHLQRLSHPVLGDANHGDTRVNRAWRQQHGLPRLALHCASLSLTPPDGPPLDVTCPLFEDLHGLFRRMPWWLDARSAHPALGAAPLPLGVEAPA
ncbi:MAG: pseudouridylate synthase [Alphaproteobacteria bacterium]|nr:pseudouridylate synthase [Alphaproteobacteria bacterium]